MSANSHKRTLRGFSSRIDFPLRFTNLGTLTRERGIMTMLDTGGEDTVEETDFNLGC